MTFEMLQLQLNDAHISIGCVAYADKQIACMSFKLSAGCLPQSKAIEKEHKKTKKKKRKISKWVWEWEWKWQSLGKVAGKETPSSQHLTNVQLD